MFTVGEVVARDGWRCHLCGHPVDPDAVAPNPGAATVDHLLPLRRGGGDDEENVRLAHLVCNSFKRDRLPGTIPRAAFRELYDTSVAGTGEERCRRCGRGFTRAATGRPRLYCRESCRQMDYQQRRRAKELGLGESELVMARAELDELRDALYVLEAAIEDVDRDLAEVEDDPVELRRAVDWLLQAARPLLTKRL